jgi:hypothetical protein
MITTTNIQLLFTKTRPPLESNIRRSLFEAIINKPSYFPQLLDSSIDGYLSLLDYVPRGFSKRLKRTHSTSFTGLNTVDYKTIWQNSDLTLEEKGIGDKELRVLLNLLDLAPTDLIDSDQLGHFSENQLQNLHMLKSIVIISTILFQYLGSQEAVKFVSQVLFPTLPYSCELDILIKCKSRSVKRSKLPGLQESDEPGTRPKLSITRSGDALRHIIVWSTVGRIAGFQKTAKQMAASRARMWDAENKWPASEVANKIHEFLEWFISKPHEHFFTISIGNEAGRAAGAVVYAMAECLVHFGFLLTLPTIVVHQNNLFAEVERITLEEDNVFQVNSESLAKTLEAAQSERLLWKSKYTLEREILKELQARGGSSGNPTKFDIIGSDDGTGELADGGSSIYSMELRGSQEGTRFPIERSRALRTSVPNLVLGLGTWSGTTETFTENVEEDNSDSFRFE